MQKRDSLPRSERGLTLERQAALRSFVAASLEKLGLKPVELSRDVPGLKERSPNWVATNRKRGRTISVPIAGELARRLLLAAMRGNAPPYRRLPERDRLEFFMDICGWLLTLGEFDNRPLLDPRAEVIANSAIRAAAPTLFHNVPRRRYRAALSGCHRAIAQFFDRNPDAVHGIDTTAYESGSALQYAPLRELFPSLMA
jgi:hypothetical protein